MKNKFIPKGQTRFATPYAKFRKNGVMRIYHKSVKLPVGSVIVARNQCEQTDEGYSAVYECLENKNGVLYRIIQTESRDCDGRYSSESEQKLVQGVWVDINSSQRDYTAESMGY